MVPASHDGDGDGSGARPRATATTGADAMTVDPVRARRARIAGLVHLAKRVGYGSYLVASVLFGIGFVGGFTEGLTTAIVAGLAVGSITLAPAIVFGFAVSAADRDDAERGL